MNERRTLLTGPFAGSRLQCGVGIQLAVSALICVFTASRGYADKVVLVEGDTIEGTVTKQTHSVVVLAHPDLGRIEIPKSRVESVQIDVPEVTIVLTDGETIRGKKVEEDDSFIVLEHKDLGSVKIPKDHITSAQVGLGEARIVLAGGDTIEGTLLERTEYAIVIEHPTLGRLEIPRVRIELAGGRGARCRERAEAGAA